MELLKQFGIDFDPIEFAKYLWVHHHSKLDVLVISSVLIFIFLMYDRRQKNYFKNRGMKNLPYDFPIVGNAGKVITYREHMRDVIYRTYNAFPDQKYVGFMQINFPLIVIRDLELIKQVGIKDFDHFVNHQVVVSDEVDPIGGGHLFALKGEKWRNMRATLSPAFTSSKMKNMFQYVNEIGAQMVEYYVNEMSKSENAKRGYLHVEMKDAFTKYTNDIIATSAFGVKTNSLDEPDNTFFQMGKEVTNFSGLRALKFFLITSFPKLAKLIGMRMLSNDLEIFFRHLVLDTMKNREQNGVIRHDMINLLMEARKGDLKHDESKTEDENAGFATVQESEVGKVQHKKTWTDDEMVAQAFLFFAAGFETASTLLCFLAHELTVNPETQKKLLEEIDQIIAEKNGEIQYGDLVKMKYMDMVVSETLRKWPPVFSVDRECVKDFKLPPPSEDETTGYMIKKGEAILLPIYGLHHDPEYYPNPEKFDPDRFSDDNKHQINPLTFLPFGVGPRNCIGSRFALMEAKSVVFHLLSKFEFVETTKTTKDIELVPNSFFLLAKGGFWIGLKPRY